MKNPTDRGWRNIAFTRIDHDFCPLRASADPAAM